MKFYSLDAFRGLAAVMVVLFHSRFYTSVDPFRLVQNSYLFVDFFFILSGFIMAHAYLGKLGGKVGWKKFILLRIGRLYPLHLFMLLVWLPYIILKVFAYNHGFSGTDPSEINNSSTFFAHLFLLQSLGMFEQEFQFSWNFPSWSISTEFYTYIIFLGSALAFYRFHRSSFLILSILVSSVFLLWVFGEDGDSQLRPLAECIGFFFSGVVLHTLFSRLGVFSPNSSLATVMEIGVILWVLLAIVFLGDSATSLWNVTFSFWGLILVFSSQSEGWVSFVLRARLFQKLGSISYSIYMVHALILSLAYNAFLVFVDGDVVLFSAGQSGVVSGGAAIINMGMLGIVILCSKWTYQWIEVPWRLKFRALAEKVDASGGK